MVERLAWVVITAVVIVWLGTFLVLPFLIAAYSPPPSVGTVMGSLAGGAAAYLFASKAAKKNGKDDEPLPLPPPPEAEPEAK